MGAGKSSIRHTFKFALPLPRPYHSPSLACLDCPKPIGPLSGHAGSNAVNSQRDSVDFDRTHCRYGAGCALAGPRSWQAISRGIFWGFAAAVFVLGTLLCARFRMERNPAYRYAGASRFPPLSCLFRVHTLHGSLHCHRFFEVSVGILVALALVAVVAGASTRNIRKTKR